MPRQAFEKAKRILNHSEFRQTYDAGHKIQTPGLTIFWNKVSVGQSTRFGIQVSKRCGNAVRRNAIKRGLRELIRTYPQPWCPGYNVVLIPKPGYAPKTVEEAKKHLYHAIEKILI